MVKDLGSGYKYKKQTIKYPNGDIYEGMAAAYYSGNFEPHGEGTYFNKSSGVTFKANWEHRCGPDFNTIQIINKPSGQSFLLVQVYAGEIYSNLVYLGIIKVKEGQFAFKNLECIVLEPHASPKNLLTIKSFNDHELVFDFTGPMVDHGSFIDKVAPKGEPKKYSSTVASHIIWNHDDEYDVTKTASIDILYF